MAYQWLWVAIKMDGPQIHHITGIRKIARKFDSKDRLPSL